MHDRKIDFSNRSNIFNCIDAKCKSFIEDWEIYFWFSSCYYQFSFIWILTTQNYIESF